MTPRLKKGPKIHLHEDRRDIILKLPPPQSFSQRLISSFLKFVQRQYYKFFDLNEKHNLNSF